MLRFRVISILRALLLAVLVLGAAEARAQFRPPVNTSDPNNFAQGNLQTLPPNYNQEPEDTTAKVKPPRVRKPLESFYFDDSTRMSRFFSWSVSLVNNDVKMQPLDTLADFFQLDYSFKREDVGDIYLGNVGGATVPLNYFRRPAPRNFSFLRAWTAYILTPEQVRFYNTRVPYTRINYGMSELVQFEENLFSALLSHNISPSTNLNILYDAVATKGQYMYQKTLDRNVSINFAHTGKRYAIHGGYIYNHATIQENGGIKSDSEVLDTVVELTRNIGVNLASANNLYRGHTFWMTQSYAFPLRAQREDELTIQKIPSLFLGMSAEYATMGKRYTDNGEDKFYKNHYISDVATADTVGQTLLDLRAFTQIQPYNRDGLLGVITAGLGTDMSTYRTDEVPEAYRPLYGNGGAVKKTGTYIYGSAEGSLKRYLRWDADARLGMFGYRGGDLDAGGRLRTTAFVKGNPITLDAALRLSLRSPDYWDEWYFSNHYAWANSFEKESATTISARLAAPHWGLEAGANYQMVTNKVYYDSVSMPAQFGGSVSVMGIYLRKDFKLGILRLNHRVMMQWSSNEEVIPVPMLSAYLSYYLQFDVVKDVLRLNLGFDGRYETQWWAFGYNPAIAQFYNQREKKLGGYPYLDAFAAAKWKRMRLYVKLQHLNANLTKDRNYFQVLHQPQNRMMFKLGVSWAFYE